MWLVLLMLSTLLVYQHHFIDITTGLMAGFLTLWMFPYRKKRNQQIATVYFFVAAVGLTALLFAIEHSVLGSIFFIVGHTRLAFIGPCLLSL